MNQLKGMIKIMLDRALSNLAYMKDSLCIAERLEGQDL